MSEKPTAKIEVPKDDPKGKKDETFAQKDAMDEMKAKALLEKKPDDAPEDDDMSEEDRKLRDTLTTLVEVILEATPDANAVGVQLNALNELRSQIRSSTSSMTAVPKPLKFLRPFYPALRAWYARTTHNRHAFADVMSMLAVTFGRVGVNDSLYFRLEADRAQSQLKSTSKDTSSSTNTSDMAAWGAEYVRHLAGEVGSQFHAQLDQDDGSEGALDSQGLSTDPKAIKLRKRHQDEDNKALTFALRRKALRVRAKKEGVPLELLEQEADEAERKAREAVLTSLPEGMSDVEEESESDSEDEDEDEDEEQKTEDGADKGGDEGKDAAEEAKTAAKKKQIAEKQRRKRVARSSRRNQRAYYRSVPETELKALIDLILAFQIGHNAEYEAVDLLLEVEQFNRIKEVCTGDNYERVCRYALACIEYYPENSDRVGMLTRVYECYTEHADITRACLIALKMGDRAKVLECFEWCDEKEAGEGDSASSASSSTSSSSDDSESKGESKKTPPAYTVTQKISRPLLKQACALLCARQGVVLQDLEDDDETYATMGNAVLHEQYLRLAQELDAMAPKTPEDMYKRHLEEGRARVRDDFKRQVDSAKENLAATFVNALVNCGFGEDTLMTPETSEWVFKNKGVGKLSASASMGLIHLWDLDRGLNAVDKYSYSSDAGVKAGGYLGTGIISASVTSDMDAALGLLSEPLEDDEDGSIDVESKKMCVLGLGFAYANSAREDVLEVLMPVVMNPELDAELIAYTYVAIGMVFVGTNHEEVAPALIEALKDRSDEEVRGTVGRLMAIGLGLLFLGQGEKVETHLATIKQELGASLMSNSHPFIAYVQVTCRACAFFGTNHVGELQGMMNLLRAHFKDEDSDEEEDDEEADAAEAKVDVAENELESAVVMGDDDDTDDDGILVDEAGEADVLELVRTGSVGGIGASELSSPTAGAGASSPAGSPTRSRRPTRMKDDDDTTDDEEDGESKQDKKEDPQARMVQDVALLGVGMLSMGESLSTKMCLRLMDHVLQFGELNQRRVLPLALGFLFISSCDLDVQQVLLKLAHDSDEIVSQNATLALGFLGAGTNNSRIASTLRSLAVYYTYEANHLFLVRLAQGLLYMGKGLLTLHPYHSDGILYNRGAVAGLLVVFHACLDMKNTLLGDRHYLLYALCTAIRPRFVSTVDENMKPVTCEIRVGKAIDVSGQAGKPKAITGYQSHKSPVLLSHGEKAELANDDYLVVGHVLEGIIMVQENQNSQAKVTRRRKQALKAAKKRKLAALAKRKASKKP